MDNLRILCRWKCKCTLSQAFQTEESLFKDNGDCAHTRAAIETREFAYDRTRCYLAQRVIHLITFSLSFHLSLPFSLSLHVLCLCFSRLFPHHVLDFPPHKHFVREFITCYTLRRVENVSFYNLRLCTSSTFDF